MIGKFEYLKNKEVKFLGRTSETVKDIRKMNNAFFIIECHSGRVANLNLFTYKGGWCDEIENSKSEPE